MVPDASPSPKPARDGYVPVAGASLFYRDIGVGHPVVVLHGGAEFDHAYLVPEMDALADSCRLIFYDQRGRGRSSDGVKPEDVTIASEVSDLDALADHFRLESFAVLGHSWGGVLAMEYTLGHPDRVSHLILMNTAPASHLDFVRVREHLLSLRRPEEVERMREIAISPEFHKGDLAVDAEYLRIHFRPALPEAELVDLVIARLRTHFTAAMVLTARAIDLRLTEETWLKEDYDLLPQLARQRPRTLVIHGDQDFIPVEIAEHIAQAIPGARFVVVPGCGHFAYLEQPALIRDHISDFVTRG